MRQFECITVQYFEKEELLFWKIKDTGMPNFCLKGLQEFKEFCSWVRTYFSHPDRPLKFIVSGSEHAGIYNMGGDLAYFVESIKNQNVAQLSTYAYACIEAIYNMYTAFGLPVITIALVEGNAYGGGFECALAHDFIIAAKDTQFCLPENKFNLFPGMGAHSLLMRKVEATIADKIVRSKEIYKAPYLEELGLIATTAHRGKTMRALYQFTNNLKDRFNFEYHHIQCKKKIHPLTKEELIDITELWVGACMKVTSFDLRRMQIIVAAQNRRNKAVV